MGQPSLQAKKGGAGSARNLSTIVVFFFWGGVSGRVRHGEDHGTVTSDIWYEVIQAHPSTSPPPSTLSDRQKKGLLGGDAPLGPRQPAVRGRSLHGFDCGEPSADPSADGLHSDTFVCSPTHQSAGGLGLRGRGVQLRRRNGIRDVLVHSSCVRPPSPPSEPKDLKLYQPGGGGGLTPH